MSNDFKLWLEFEEVQIKNFNSLNGFCNIQVKFPDGRSYGISVWTYRYFETSIKDDKKNGHKLNGLYQIPPDLFVQELSRECIEQTISHLLEMGELDKVLNSSVLK